MRRIAISLALAAAPAAAQIDVTSPVVGDEELAGVSTIVTFDIAPGLQAIRGRVRDGGLLEVTFDVNGVSAPGNLTLLDGPAFYSESMGNAGLRVDLAEIDISGVLGVIGAADITIKCRTTDGNSRYETAPSSSDEAVDELLRVVHPTHPRPALDGVSADPKTGVLRMVFSEPLTTLDPLNDDNHTIIGALSGDDFQFSANNVFDGSEPALAGLSNPRLENDDPTVVLFDYVPLLHQLTTGYIRPAFGADGEPLPSTDLRSVTGYPVSPRSRLLLLPEPVNPGDINGDGAADSSDLAIVLSGWGACPSDPAPARRVAAPVRSERARGAGPIDVTNPVMGDEEFAGPETVVSLRIQAGLNGSEMLDGDQIVVTFDLLNADGFVLFGDFFTPITGSHLNYIDALGNELQADLSGAIPSSLIGNPLIHSLRFRCRTAGGDGNFLQAAFDADDETIDETIELVPPDARPALLSAIADGGTNTFTLEFSAPLTNFDPSNNDNNTDPALVNGADLQLSPTPEFGGAEPGVSGIANARFEDDDPFRLVFDLAEGVSNLIDGGRVRPAHDASGAPTDAMSIRDALGYDAASDAVEVILLNICPSDLNGDGVTNSSDLAIVLASWTPS